MQITRTGLEGCILLEPKVYKDERGYFAETYNKQIFDEAAGYKVSFVQDNQSFSKMGVIRALHYQVGEHAQAKLVRVLQGEVMDVAVDLRKDSPTFGEHVAFVLSAANKKQLFIPRGFAHGFVTLSETAEFFYKCDNYYRKEAEGGIIFNDDTLKINWKLPSESIIVSEKDAALPVLRNARL